MEKKYISIRVKSDWDLFNKEIPLQDPIWVKDDNNISREVKKIVVDIDGDELNNSLLKKSKDDDSFFVLLESKDMNWKNDEETLFLSGVEVLPLFLTKKENDLINNSEEKKKRPELVQKITDRHSLLDKNRKDFVNWIENNNVWRIPTETTDEADDEYSNLTPLTLRNWLLGQNKIDATSLTWKDYIFDQRISNEIELGKRKLLIKKYLFTNFNLFNGKKSLLLNNEQKESIINDHRIDEQLRNEAFLWEIWAFISQLADLKNKLEQTRETNKKKIAYIKQLFNKYKPRKKLFLGNFYAIATKDSSKDSAFDSRIYRPVYNFLNEKTDNLIASIFNNPESYTRTPQDNNDDEQETKSFIQFPILTVSYQSEKEKYWKFNSDKHISFDGDKYDALCIEREYISEEEIKTRELGERFFLINLPLINKETILEEFEEEKKLQLDPTNDLVFIPLKLLKDKHANLLVEIEPINYEILKSGDFSLETKSTINYLKISKEEAAKLDDLQKIISVNNERLPDGSRRTPGIFSTLNWGKKLVIEDLVWNIEPIKKQKRGWTTLSAWSEFNDTPFVVNEGNALTIGKTEIEKTTVVSNRTKYRQVIKELSDLIKEKNDLLRTNFEDLTAVNELIEKLRLYENARDEKEWAYTYYEGINDFGKLGDEGYTAGSPAKALKSLLNREKSLNPKETSDEEEELPILAEIKNDLELTENVEEIRVIYFELTRWIDENSIISTEEKIQIVGILTTITKKILARLNDFKDKEIRDEWKNDNDYTSIFEITNNIYLGKKEKLKDFAEEILAKGLLSAEEKSSINAVKEYKEKERQAIIHSYYQQIYQNETFNWAKIVNYFENVIQNGSMLRNRLFGQKLLQKILTTTYAIIDQEKMEELENFLQSKVSPEGIFNSAYRGWERKKDFYQKKSDNLQIFAQAWETAAKFYRGEVLGLNYDATEEKINEALAKNRTKGITDSQDSVGKNAVRFLTQEEKIEDREQAEFILSKVSDKQFLKLYKGNEGIKKIDTLEKLILANDDITGATESVLELLAKQVIADKCAWLRNNEYDQEAALKKIMDETDQKKKLQLLQTALQSITRENHHDKSAEKDSNILSEVNQEQKPKLLPEDLNQPLSDQEKISPNPNAKDSSFWAKTIVTVIIIFLISLLVFFKYRSNKKRKVN